MSSKKMKKSGPKSSNRVVYLNLEALTDEERTTEEEESTEEEVMQSNGLPDISSYESKAKVLIKKCDEEFVKPFCEKSAKNVCHFGGGFEDKKVNIKSDSDVKDIKKVFKCDINFQESKECLKTLKASTSREELKDCFSGQKCGEISDDLPERCVQMKDSSTDPRYHCRSLNSSEKISKVSLKSSSLSSDPKVRPTETTPTIADSTSVKKFWTYVCLNCFDIFESKKVFCNHFDEIHTKTQNLAKKYLKSEFDSTLSATKRHKSRHKSKLNPVSHSHHSSHSSKDKKSKKKVSKHKKKQKLKPISPKPPVSHPVSEKASPTAVPLQYRLVQKCKICSFTPLINSMEEIKDHIIKEHKCDNNVRQYYSDILVKISPKQT